MNIQQILIFLFNQIGNLENGFIGKIRKLENMTKVCDNFIVNFVIIVDKLKVNFISVYGEACYFSDGL